VQHDQRTRGPEHWVAGTLLARLSAETRAELFELAPIRRYAAGTVLLRQGDKLTHHAYILRRARHSVACAKITAQLPNGSETLLGIRLCGDVVGELAALHGSPRQATVTTCRDVEAHVIQAKELKMFLARHPSAWLAMSQTIADRLEWSNQRRLDYLGYPVVVRLARMLLTLADRHGYPISEGQALGVLLNHDELGMLIGAGRDAVGQAVRKLKAASLISSSYRMITIVDPDGLHSYAEPTD
jgi:CRP/FNR family cyclic AMP-dependent transcriptional regulator